MKFYPLFLRQNLDCIIFLLFLLNQSGTGIRKKLFQGMKIYSLFLSGLVLLFFTATCSSVPKKDTIEATGIIEQQGMTSYQYGTHTLTGPDTFYALKSETIDLDLYLGEEVSITGRKVEGYPLEGGPVFLNVLEVE